MVVAQGAVRGVVRPTATGAKVAEFKGIPFAQPPLGAARFAPPRPPANWTGVYDASEFKHNCAPSPPAQGPRGLLLLLPHTHTLLATLSPLLVEPLTHAMRGPWPVRRPAAGPRVWRPHAASYMLRSMHVGCHGPAHDGRMPPRGPPPDGRMRGRAGAQAYKAA